MEDRVAASSAAGVSRRTCWAAALASFTDMLLLLLVGVVSIADGLRIILTETDTVGNASAGGWLVALGALLVAGTCGLSVKETRSQRGTVTLGASGEFWSPIAALTILLIYIALIASLGYLLSTVLFMAIYLRVFGKYSVGVTATISIGFALGSDWVWRTLDMTLPQGILNWP